MSKLRIDYTNSKGTVCVFIAPMKQGIEMLRLLMMRQEVKIKSVRRIKNGY